MSRKICIISVFLLSLAFFVKAQESQNNQQFQLLPLLQWDIKYLWTEVFGLPAEWTQPRSFIFNFLVPFLAIFAIILGILRQLEIFHRTPGVEMFIAFSMAFMTLPSKIFITIVSVTLGIAGVLSSLGFILLFILGSLLYSAGGLFFKPLGFLQQQKALSKIYGGYHKGAESLEKELKMIRVQIAKVQADMLREKPGANLTPYIRKIEALRKQEEDIIKKLEALKFSLKI